MPQKKTQRKKGAGTLVLRGKKYFARWTVDGKIYTRTTETGNLKDATAKLAEFTAPFRMGSEARTLETISARIQGVRGEIQRHEDEQPALSVLAGWQAYMQSTKRPDTGPDTLRMYESQYSRLVNWLTEKHPDAKELREITPPMAKEFAQALAAELSPGSFNKYMTLFRRVWKVLTKDAKLTCNPWDKDEIRPKRDTPTSRRELTLEELAEVCAAVSGEMRTLFAVGIYTGLRLGDAARLSWGDVDLVRGVISIVPHKTAHSSRGKRTSIPIHPALFEVLAETPAKDRRGYVMPDTARQYEESTAALCKKIQTVFIRCGLQTISTGNGRGRVEVGFHSLRHTFVSLSANAGTPLAIVQAIVGHSNPAMTRHYYHESAEALQGAIAALPNVTTGTATGTAILTPETLPMSLGELVRVHGWDAVNAEIQAMRGEA